ncbi:MAG TPA: hypothetical protein VET82_08720, partial [Candidatus Eisenbacteria bacterium]|nr:hypothetical protein [Candidatus Eisenbacteria bacterium]
AEHYQAARAEAASTPAGLFYADMAAIAAAARPLLPPSAQRDYDRNVAARLGPITALIMTSQSRPSSLSQLVFVLITGSAGVPGGTQA